MQIDSQPVLAEPAAPQRAAWAIGTAVLGRPAYLNTGSAAALGPDRSVDAMRAKTAEVLDAAAAAGVDWVDTARSYGRAEEFVADWLGGPHPADFVPPTISSKWGYRYVGQWRTDAQVHEIKEHSLAQFRRQWAESSDQLGDVLGLYQVHSLTPDSPLFTDDDLLAALAELRAGGIALGFSTSGPEQAETIERAAALMVDSQPLFSAVQSTWNLLERSVGTALQAAKAAGLTVLVKEALANGRLVTSPPLPVAALSDQLGVGVDAVALAAVAVQPFADRVLLGAADPQQLQSNLLADKVIDLARDELPTLTESAAEDPDDYWQRRSELPWH